VYQGEGPHAGKRCWFVRFGLCNLHCTWCDTPYTWDRTRYDVDAECPVVSVEVVLAQLHDRGWRPGDMLVLSGGEPLIHARQEPFVTLCEVARGNVHIETNGTIVPPLPVAERVAHWSVSPKINDQGDPQHRRLRPRAVAWFAAQRSAIFKIVCRTPAEVVAVAQYAKTLDLRTDRVWIMPEGIDRATVLACASAIEETTLAAGFNLTLRQHVLLHGNERGF
jgi:organic radical activating enzyme